jgi:hypothetical protein
MKWIDCPTHRPGGIRRHLVRLVLGLMLGPGAVAAAEETTIALPPFLVEEAAQPLPWRYAEVGGCEVLSTCPDRLTRELVANHLRLHALLGELVPPALQWRTSERPLLIFVDSAHQPPTSPEVVAQLVLSAVEPPVADDAPAADDGRLRRRPKPPRYTFLPNLRLWDRDGQALFAIVREREFDPGRVALSPEYVTYVLRHRIPALPPWFVSGVLTLFSTARFGDDALTLERLDWPAESGVALLRGGAGANRAPLPLAQFFAGDLPAGDPAGEERLALWQAQAALFVRWGVGGRGAPRREAWEKFVARAAVEPVTEALVRECFGLDFAAVEKALAACLPAAMNDPLELRPARRRPPEFSLRPAGEAEIARLKGDWERLEIGYVKARFPALAPKYVEQARRTLRRAYDRGSRDPRLLAVMGLCEVDAGSDGTARVWLEAAAGAPALRPRAAYELARLRFAAARAPGDGAPPVLAPEQVAAVLAPLAVARAGLPPLPEVFELLAAVRAAAAAAPTREQLAELEAGVRLFPRRPGLAAGTAELALRHGFVDTARWVIALGLTLAPDPATRARFEALQARLGAER